MYHNRKVRLQLNLNEMFDEFPATFVATKEVGETKGKNYIYILLFSMKFPTEKQRANYVWTFLNRINMPFSYIASQNFNATIMKVQPSPINAMNGGKGVTVPFHVRCQWKCFQSGTSERQPGEGPDCQTISAVGQMATAVYGKFLQMYNLCCLGWNWPQLRVFGFHKIHKWPDHFYQSTSLIFQLYPWKKNKPSPLVSFNIF